MDSRCYIFPSMLFLGSVAEPVAISLVMSTTLACGSSEQGSGLGPKSATSLWAGVHQVTDSLSLVIFS